ncbi:Autophagy protein 22 [Podila verticillata]|nr:Autophagy protein 22 [Podila verticillata]
MTMDSEIEPTPSPYPDTKLGRFKHKLLFNDPKDAIELQPHLTQRMTRKSEFWGFFAFGFGYYAYANVCSSLLVPILLQQVARGAAHLESNPLSPCPDSDDDIPAGDRCLVPFGWILVNPTSYVLLTGVISTWLMVAVSLGTSALADHGRVSRKFMVFFCSMQCVFASLMFIGVLKPQLWWLTSVTNIIATVFGGAVLNFYDANISILSRHHPDAVRALVKYGPVSQEYNEAKTKIQTFLSGGASAAGYGGGLIVTIIVALILMFTEGTALIVAYSVILVCVYILFFNGVYLKLSYQRTFPPLPKGASWLTYGYVRIARTARKAAQLKTMFFFLICWFILGDGLAAASSMAILIAQDSLQLSSTGLIAAALVQLVTAGLGMVFWIWVQNSKGVAPLKIVIINTCCFGMLPAYCLLGLIPSSPIGLKQEWELYMLAAFFGFFSGAIYSSNRVVFAQFIPYGHENEMFALYEMSSVSSSWIGETTSLDIFDVESVFFKVIDILLELRFMLIAPLVCTAIIESSTVRHTWAFLVTQFFLPAIMLLFVNVEKGRADANAFYEKEQETKKQALLDSAAEMVQDGSGFEPEKDVSKTV